MDSRVVLFATAVSCLTVVVFGLVPLVHAVKRNRYGAIKATGTSTTDAMGTQRFRQALVMSQIALVLVLLTGTGLMLRAFWKMQEVDVGFSSKGITTFFVSLPYTTYPIEAARKFWPVLRERLNAISGVERVSLSAGLPPVMITDAGVGAGVWIEGLTPSATGTAFTVSTERGPLPVADQAVVVSPGYFQTLKIRLVSGRFFDERDGSKAPEVTIVNQSMARAFWGNESALGRRIQPISAGEWYTVVGVIADVKNNGVNKPTGTEFYLPSAQAPFWWNAFGRIQVLRIYEKVVAGKGRRNPAIFFIYGSNAYKVLAGFGGFWRD